MLTLEEIRDQLQDRRLNIVSEKTGVSYDSIKTIRDGEHNNPGYQMVKKLSDYLQGKLEDSK